HELLGSDPDLCFAPVASPSEAAEHPHHRARNAFTMVDGWQQPAPAPRFTRNPGAVQGGSPRPGAHTREALTDWGLSSTHVDARVNQAARALADRGLRRGDRVAVLMGNSMATVELYFALFRLGAVLVPVNLRFVAAEIAYILADSGARMVVVDHAFAPTVARA